MRHVCVGIGIALILATCVPLLAAQSKDFYFVPKEEVQKKVHTIAMRPCLLPLGTKNSTGISHEFESLIEQKLHAKGYTTVAPSEYESILIELAKRLGGIFDPVTGEPNRKKAKTAKDYTYREVVRKYHADAFLACVIYIGDAIPSVHPSLFSQGYYEVWGDPILWNGKPLPGTLDNLPQKVLASYLALVLVDPAAVKLYGIKVPIEWTKVFVARGYEEKPHLYSNRARNQKAVDLALDPLVRPK